MYATHFGFVLKKIKEELLGFDKNGQHNKRKCFDHIEDVESYSEVSSSHVENE